MTELRITRLYCLVAVIQLSACLSLNYSIIKEAGASCFPKDSCNIPRDTSPSAEKSCDCDEKCSDYRTCCIDKPYKNETEPLYRKSACTTVGHVSVFMVNSCNRRYRGSPEIKRICEEEPSDWSDPLANAPMTNPQTGVTYRSMYCALCNKERLQYLIMWQTALDCSSLGTFMNVCTENREFVISNMMYIKAEGKWGLWSSDKKKDWKFRFLEIDYNLPDTLYNTVKFCRPNLISKCSRDWDDSEVKRLCKSYMGAIYFAEGAFRNVHCAICNGVRNITELMSCNPLDTPPFRSVPGMSFGLLLDVNLKNGNTVGMVNRCSEGEMYDPFFKKCRTLVCPIPGYKLRNKRCVKE